MKFYFWSTQITFWKRFVCSLYIFIWDGCETPQPIFCFLGLIKPNFKYCFKFDIASICFNAELICRLDLDIDDRTCSIRFNLCRLLKILFTRAHVDETNSRCDFLYLFANRLRFAWANSGSRPLRKTYENSAARGG